MPSPALPTFLSSTFPPRRPSASARSTPRLWQTSGRQTHGAGLLQGPRLHMVRRPGRKLALHFRALGLSLKGVYSQRPSSLLWLATVRLQPLLSRSLSHLLRSLSTLDAFLLCSRDVRRFGVLCWNPLLSDIIPEMVCTHGLPKSEQHLSECARVLPGCSCAIIISSFCCLVWQPVGRLLLPMKKGHTCSTSCNELNRRAVSLWLALFPLPLLHLTSAKSGLCSAHLQIALRAPHLPYKPMVVPPRPWRGAPSAAHALTLHPGPEPNLSWLPPWSDPLLRMRAAARGMHCSWMARAFE